MPAFFFKRDAIPGRTNEFEVTIDEAGRYGGQCAEFCGLNHSQMFFNIRAVDPAEYETWLAEKAAGGPTPADQASEDKVVVDEVQSGETPADGGAAAQPVPSTEPVPDEALGLDIAATERTGGAA